MNHLICPICGWEPDEETSLHRHLEEVPHDSWSYSGLLSRLHLYANQEALNNAFKEIHIPIHPKALEAVKPAVPMCKCRMAVCGWTGPVSEAQQWRARHPATWTQRGTMTHSKRTTSEHEARLASHRPVEPTRDPALRPVAPLATADQGMAPEAGQAVEWRPCRYARPSRTAL